MIRFGVAAFLRRSFRMRLLASLFLSLLPLAAQDLQVGRAAVLITPPTGAPLAGYYALRLATGTHDDLQAKAIVMEAGGQKAALVACDLVNLPPALMEEARRLAAQRTGIPAGNILISATHSHTGPVLPSGNRESAFGGDHPVTRAYASRLPGLIAEAVAKADQSRQPARASTATGREPSVSFNRRFFLRDGTVGWNPGKRNPQIVRPAGPIDPDLPVLLFESTAGEPLATYVNFALHLDTVGGTEFSADYPATLSSLLGRTKGKDMLTLFTIGAAGNINHIDTGSLVPQKGPQEAARIGTVLAGEVLKTYTKLRPLTSAGLQVRSETVPLDLAAVSPVDVDKAHTVAAAVSGPAPPPFLETVRAFKVLDVAARQGKPYEAEVQVITLGDEVAWVGLPGEVFTELGQAIKRESPFPQTIVVELAHGPVTYLPNEAAFPQGNYEVVTSRVAEGSGEKLAASALRLLNAMHPRGNTTPEAITPRQTISLFDGKTLNGWYTWTRDSRYADPKSVFAVKDGMLRISGEEWGGLATRDRYRDYRLVVEWKWGGKAWPPRDQAARDSGVLVHAGGPDGAHGGIWLESIEAQIIEGGTGDFIVVPGFGKPSLSAEVRDTPNGETYWQKGGRMLTRTAGRFNWYARDPNWKDALSHRGPSDVEKPVGEWNHYEVICRRDTITTVLNGVTMNQASRAVPQEGKIQLQSEGAEIWFRKVELQPLP